MKLAIVNFFSIYVCVQRLLNYYPNYSTRRLYFGEVETPYCLTEIHSKSYERKYLQLVLIFEKIMIGNKIMDLLIQT